MQFLGPMHKGHLATLFVTGLMNMTYMLSVPQKAPCLHFLFVPLESAHKTKENLLAQRKIKFQIKPAVYQIILMHFCLGLFFLHLAFHFLINLSVSHLW